MARRPLRLELTVLGLTLPDPRAVRSLTAPCDGRLQWPRNPVEGDTVQAGELLGSILSPERLELETRYVELLRLEAGLTSETGRDERRRAAHAREEVAALLMARGYDATQLRALAQSLAPSGLVPITAPVTGVLVRVAGAAGETVEAGAALLDVWEPRRLWVVASVPDAAATWIEPGMPVQLCSDAGSLSEGRVAGVSSSPEEGDRSRYLRVALDDRAGITTRGVALRLHLERAIGPDGLPASVPLPGYACRRHPDAVSEVPSVCPFCRESLLALERPAAEPGDPPLVVPVAACAWTAQGPCVRVLERDGRIIPRHIVTGPLVDGWVSVVAGLEEGERLVVESADPP
ncbi:MAG: efflux RND transporter periplasmic adaptor subunit [Planctomycetota bacterium]